MRDYRDLRRVYNLSLTQAFFALLEQKVLDVWETLARIGYDKSDHFDFTENRWKALPVERQIQYSIEYQKWYAERIGQPLEMTFDGSLFRLVPPGKFTFGSTETFRTSDDVNRDYEIAFCWWVGRYPVTQEEYERVMKHNPSVFKYENCPVERVNLKEMSTYCRKTEMRLLHEVEWEYACRAGTTTAYSFGADRNLLGNYAWYDINSELHLHPVGQKRANAWGLQDMHGNVSEKCGNFFFDSSDRVIRGGNFNSDARVCSSSYRLWHDNDVGDMTVGFRVKKHCLT